MSQYDHECPYCGEDAWDIQNRHCGSCGGYPNIDYANAFPILLVVLAITTALALAAAFGG
jgi:hypothetical protein